MFMKKIEELSKYLVINEGNSDDICRFLNFEIFGYLESRAIYFAQLSNDGLLHPVGDFGFTKGAVESWGEFPLTFDMPITAAVKRNACIQVNSPEELYKAFPAMSEIPNLDHVWKSIVAIPIHAFGVYSITCFKEPEIDELHEQFLRTVGQLASVAFTKSQLLKRLGSRAPKSKFVSKPVGLTKRQEVIMKLILKGLTNRQIADEIGFSDSLVRQETIAIYAYLNVAGRRELLSSTN